MENEKALLSNLKLSATHPPGCWDELVRKVCRWKLQVIINYASDSHFLYNWNLYCSVLRLERVRLISSSSLLFSPSWRHKDDGSQNILMKTWKIHLHLSLGCEITHSEWAKAKEGEKKIVFNNNFICSQGFSSRTVLHPLFITDSVKSSVYNWRLLWDSVKSSVYNWRLSTRCQSNLCLGTKRYLQYCWGEVNVFKTSKHRGVHFHFFALSLTPVLSVFVVTNLFKTLKLKSLCTSLSHMFCLSLSFPGFQPTLTLWRSSPPCRQRGCWSSRRGRALPTTSSVTKVPRERWRRPARAKRPGPRRPPWSRKKPRTELSSLGRHRLTPGPPFGTTMAYRATFDPKIMYVW